MANNNNNNTSMTTDTFTGLRNWLITIKQEYTMEVINTIKDMRNYVRKIRFQSSKAIIGLVPTMGFLHDGHMSLMRTAKEQCDIVIASIFVNPTQFAPSEDYDLYPRNMNNDLRLSRECGVHVVFIPDVKEMYPDDGVSITKVSVAKITQNMCGRMRPTFFDGVATVVIKLFNIIQPDRAYFGMKDAQQLSVVNRMVIDLNIPIDIIACPTIRDPIDDLALSSRNANLTLEERKEAAVVPTALDQVTSDANRRGATVRDLMIGVENRIATSSLARINYVEVAYYPSMRQLADVDILVRNAEGPLMIAVAVVFGTTRLIDNRIIDPNQT